MNIRLQALSLIILILASFSVTKIKSDKPPKNNLTAGTFVEIKSEKSSVSPSNFEIKKIPERKWEILDPKVSAEAILIQSLDESFPFFHLNTYKIWPLASLTKLLTAVVVLEQNGKNAKIPITERAIKTEGVAGDLKVGEIYSSEDLLKIMLLTSSNDAAAAFEDFNGGKDEFVRLLNKKAGELGMSQTLLYDASGLSDLNQGSASDILRLTKYVSEHEPEIWSWTRLEQFLVQPANEPRSHTVYNINALVSNKNFLGGKTGTSEEARENLVALFSFGNYRVAIIIFGSRDRIKETESLLAWMENAYTFPETQKP